MSKTKIKAKYIEDGEFGMIEEKTLYMEINNSNDLVTLYDDNGDRIMCYSEGQNNFEEAFVSLMYSHAEYPITVTARRKIEDWDPEDEDKIKLNGGFGDLPVANGNPEFKVIAKFLEACIKTGYKPKISDESIMMAVELLKKNA